jgi:hypothetical protein
LDTAEKLHAELKRERQWRVNATKVAERHKLKVDKLKVKNDDLTETLKNVRDEALSEIDQLKAMNDDLMRQLKQVQDNKHYPSSTINDSDGFHVEDYTDDES